MTDLFSVFNPTGVGGLPLNWFSLFMGCLLLPSSFWLTPTLWTAAGRAIFRLIYSEFQVILTPRSNPGNVWILVSLFFFISLANFSGLLPWVFTPTSHLSITLSLALPLWVGHTAISWIKQPSFALAHLVPVGTPGPLLAFMVMIELLSSLIRPITLSVRLAANMIAGHLLFVLLSLQLSTTILSPVAIGVGVVLFALSLLEMAVALIQAYVFSLLSTLYVNEVQSDTTTLTS